ncbi:RbsD/FucU domain-containing protein [Luteolibacter sp. AS25]|uniref:RbsD/FucU domain-containing protein n=1 Tax=Luteolibacter sp. AS25 TaxID=3135776 RepID=UPI00398B573C
MKILSSIFPSALFGLILGSCTYTAEPEDWHVTVDKQVDQLGYRNWIVIAEASFPAHNKPGIQQISTEAEVPEVVDYVLNCLEENQHVRPRIYLTREVRSVENDFAPGIEELRKSILTSLHAYEPTELEQQSLITLIESVNERFNVLVIRTPTALPYSSVFMELQPGYWDAESEDRLREKIRNQSAEKLAPAVP